MNSKRAYPSVITNLGRMQDQAKRFMALLNFTTISFADAHVLKDLIFAVMDSATPAGVDRLTAGNAKAIPSSPAMLAEFLASCTTANQPGNLIQGLSNSSTIKSQIQHSLQMYFVGVSLGLAYAHPNSGDTVASVMIGGLRTVQNGDYHVHTNDLLMFYFDEERDLFERDGSRIDRKTTCSAPATEAERVRFLLTFFHDGTVVPHADNTDRASRKEMERKVYYDRGNGNFPGRESNEKANTFRIKPYIVSRHKISADHHHSQHFPCDKARVFGRAISNAQPFEMVDIQLSRQAI